MFGAIAIRKPINPFALALITTLCISRAEASALNVIQTAGTIRFFADTGVYGNDGAVLDFRPKIFAVPLARSAVGVVGPVFIIKHLPLLITGATSLDHLVKEAGVAIGILSTAMAEDPSFNVSLDRGFTVIVGGFSETGERQVWSATGKIGKINNQSLMMQRWPEGQWSFTPALARDLDGQIKSAIEAGPLSADTIDSLGLAALESQRRNPITVKGWNGDRPTQIVAGHAQSVSVTFDAITSRILNDGQIF